MQCLHMVGRRRDVKLLLPSITVSVAAGLPFPVHSSPLKERRLVLEMSLACGKHAMWVAPPSHYRAL